MLSITQPRVSRAVQRGERSPVKQNLEFIGKEIHNFMAVPHSYGNTLKVSGIREKEKGQRRKAKGKS